MTIQIDQMQTRINVLARSGSGDGPASDDQGLDDLKEVLRPIVLELLNEELDAYLRVRG